MRKMTLLVACLALGSLSLVLGQEAADDKKAALEKWLDEGSVTCDFNEAPLSEVLDSLFVARHGVEGKADQQGRSFACDPGFVWLTKITFAGKGVAPRKVLNAVLEKANGEYSMWRGFIYLSVKKSAAPVPIAPDLGDKVKEEISWTVALSCRDTLDAAVRQICAGGLPLTVDPLVGRVSVFFYAADAPLGDLIDVLCRISSTKIEKDAFKKAG